jgi:hypothetical protein
MVMRLPSRRELMQPFALTTRTQETSRRPRRGTHPVQADDVDLRACSGG